MVRVFFDRMEVRGQAVAMKVTAMVGVEELPCTMILGRLALQVLRQLLTPGQVIPPRRRSSERGRTDL